MADSSNQADGIGVAVIDTGIDLTHPDLQPNLAANKTCIAGTVTGNDDNGHGSHVAGTIAAADNTFGVVGVAAKSKLVAVKVLDATGAGSWSSIICGIDWVTNVAPQYGIKVANMSLGGSGSPDANCGKNNADPLHQAICRSVAAGVTYVVAAGNNSYDASYFVPASYDDAVITVSALVDTDGKPNRLGTGTQYGGDDTFASFSNYGKPVDLAAPGVLTHSTWKNGGYNMISGTSMATPHVTGVVARYLKANPSAVWTQVRDALKMAGEPLNQGHVDLLSRHPEPVVLIK